MSERVNASGTVAATAPRPLLRLLLLLLLPLVIYLPTLAGELVGDDIQILHNPSLRQVDGWKILLRQSFHFPIAPERNEYRPLTSLTLWAQVRTSGLWPGPFHLLNLLLHLGVVIAFHGLLRRLADRATAFAAALLFAVHPLCSEAVSLVVGRADLLATLLGLVAWRLHLTGKPNAKRDGTTAWPMPWLPSLLAVGCLVAATFAKESGLTFLALILWTDLLGANKLSSRIAPRDLGLSPRLVVDRQGLLNLLKRQAILWSAVPLVILLRIFLRGPVWYEETYFFVDNPLIDASFLERQATAWWLIVKSWGLFFWPVELSVDYSYNQIPLIHSVGDWRFVVTVAAVLGVLAAVGWAWRRGERLPAWTMGGFFCLGLVTSNLVVTIGTLFGERLLYAPSLMLATLTGWLYTRFSQDRNRRLIAVLGVVLIAAFGLRTLNRSFDWIREERLYLRQQEIAPQSVRTWKYLAVLRLDQQRFAEALAAVDRGHDITLAWSDTWMLRSQALEGLGRLPEAIQSARRAYALGETSPAFFLHLATLLEQTGRPREALITLREGLDTHPLDARLYQAFDALRQGLGEDGEG